MRRWQLVEVEDLPACPGSIRDALTDYLQFVLQQARPLRAIAPRLRAALERTGTLQVLDLCSGAGGPWQSLREELGSGVQVRLSDRYPNTAALTCLEAGADGGVAYEAGAVDATAVPVELTGFRTLFNAFHHFPPELAREILADAVRKRQGIGVFELTQRRPAVIAGMLLVPLILFLVTPAIRPFRWSRLFWTYLVPAVPLFALWDGVVSCIRTYTPDELRAMTADLADFEWEIGEEKVRGSVAPITYAIGWPASPRQPTAGAGSE